MYIGNKKRNKESSIPFWNSWTRSSFGRPQKGTAKATARKWPLYENRDWKSRVESRTSFSMNVYLRMRIERRKCHAATYYIRGVLPVPLVLHHRRFIDLLFFLGTIFLFSFFPLLLRFLDVIIK
jgi:hypothetical protein